MVFMSIDPGETTGIAIVEAKDPQWVKTTTISKLSDAVAIIDDFIPKGLTDVIIEEKPKYDDWDENLIDDYYYLLRILRKRRLGVDLIIPGLWKPIAKAQKWSANAAKSKHEQDAYNILRYALLVHQDISIGDYTGGS